MSSYPAIAASVTMTAAYSYRVAPDLPRTALPIAMVPPTKVIVSPSTPPSFVAGFAALVEAWLLAKQPTRTGDPQLDFTATLFASTGAQQPILVIDELWAHR